MKRIITFIFLSLLVAFLLVAGKIGFTILRLPNLEWYRTNTPLVTSMMKHSGDDKGSVISPVPIEAISPRLIRAVLLSEDVSFFLHHGIDWEEFRLSIRQNIEEKSFSRGGSTITMQLTRNLFLSPGKNPVRKIEEMIIATMLEKKLSKRRILELYLNTAEFGPHIYGAEAGARYHFGVSARDLTVEQACAMAAILPSPRKWNPNNPRKFLKNRIDRLIEKYRTFCLYIPEELAPKD